MRKKTPPVDIVPTPRRGGEKTRTIPKALENTDWEKHQQAGQKVRLLQTKLKQAHQQNTVLNSVAAILGESLDLDTILHEIIKKITETFHFNVTRIYLYNTQRDELFPMASFATHPELWSRPKSFRRGQGNVGRVAETGVAVAFEDIQNSSRYEKLSDTMNSRSAGYRFFAVFPIKSKLQTVGTIVCVGSKPRRLQSSESQLITSIAHHIGVAFEKVGLFEEARTKAKELSALYSISTIINESLDLNLVLRKVMYRVIEIFAANAARIYLLDESVNEFRLLARRGLPHKSTVPHRYKFGEGITGRVAETGTPLFFDDTWNDHEFAQISRMRLGLKDVYRNQFYIPISIKGKTVGVMNFLTKAPHHFTSSETHLIRTIANHLGMAFENVSLFGKVTKQSRELTALVKINRDIASLLDRNTLLPRIAKEAQKVLGVDAVNFRLLEDKELVLAGVSHPMLSRLGPRLKLGESFVGIAAKEKRVLAIRNALLDPRLLETHRKLYRKTGWRSYLGVPMVVGNRVTGVLCLVSKKERDFSPEEIGIIASFANQAAIAVENANLFREIKNKVAELEKLNRELLEANRIKSDFMAAMSHELRTPLSAIIGYITLLQDGYGGTVGKMQKEALETVRHSSHMLLNLINNVLTLARTDAKKMPLEISCATLEDTLRHVRVYAKHLNQRRDIKISWHVDKDLPLVSTDHAKLEEILQNLISNAYKFTPRGKVVIRVRNLRNDGRIEFAVSDTGIGIGKTDLKRAFEKFHQGPQAHLGAHRGMGLGLSIVKHFLHLMKGHLHVESKPNVGSTFRFTLPYSI